MRILYVVTGAEFGGAPAHVLALAKHFRQRGHDVAICGAPEEVLKQKAIETDIQFFENRHFIQPVRPWRDVIALVPVLRAMRRFAPDIIHAHSTKAHFAACLCAPLLRLRPVVLTAHGWAFAEGRSQWRRWLFAQGERMACGIAKKIVCVSQHDRELALRFRVARPAQLAVVHNGIDPGPFLQANGERVRRELELQRDLTLTFVGRLATQKDPLTLLQAVQGLPNCKLLIVGDGPLRSEVESLIGRYGMDDRVILTGFRTDVPAILHASDVFVLPTHWEGLPYVILEAMMSGLPVVAANVGGIPELVEEGKTGFLVPPKDPQAFAQALQTLLLDPDLRERMGRLGRQRALEGFTLDRMLDSVRSHYEEAVGCTL